MKKKIIGIMLCGLLLLILAGNIIKKESKAQKPEWVLTYAENQPEDYPTTLGGYYFAELVEERTEGRIRIIVQASGKLGDEQEVVKQLQFGGIDFTRASLSSLGDNIDKLNVLQMPFLYTDSEHMWKVLDGEIGNEFLDAFSESNMVALAWYDAGARNFYNSVRAIHSVQDIKGLRIRVQESSLMVDLVNMLGAAAVPISYADVYADLEQGMIDGAENNWPSYESSGHYKMAGYYTIDEHTRVPEVQLCAESTWNKLSEEDRKIILECARESAFYERKLWNEREKQSRETVLKSGVQVVELTADEKKEFQEAVGKIYEIYCGEYREVIDKIRQIE